MVTIWKDINLNFKSLASDKNNIGNGYDNNFDVKNTALIKSESNFFSRYYPMQGSEATETQ